MAVSSQMNGANQVWQLGYTGAGTRIAVIDTGLMLDHETFDPGAFDYAIAEDAQKARHVCGGLHPGEGPAGRC